MTPSPRPLPRHFLLGPLAVAVLASQCAIVSAGLAGCGGSGDAAAPAAEAGNPQPLQADFVITLAADKAVVFQGGQAPGVAAGAARIGPARRGA